jgi:N-acetyl sugar amidotransferase
MDTSDPKISFDADGVCNHCHKYVQLNVVPQREKDEFANQLARMRAESGRYNCLIGVSGGLDSTFLVLHAVRDLGLRPLVVHVDNGWNTGLACRNIQKLCSAMQLELVTVVLDWPEFRDMQRAILAAGTPDLEAPTDLFINYTLRAVARQHGIRFLFSGTNPQTEGVMGTDWSYGQRDPIYLRGLFKRFNGYAPQRLPFMTLAQSFGEQLGARYEIVRPLKFIRYSRPAVAQRCHEEAGWTDYARKHGESFITRFYQNYFLPVRFGFDKRRAHYSALILNGDLQREAALAKLGEALSGPGIAAEIAYFCKKLSLTRPEFDALLSAPLRFHYAYPTIKSTWWFRLGKWAKRFIGTDNAVYKAVVRLITS